MQNMFMKYMYAQAKNNSKMLAILTIFGVFLCFFLIFSTTFAFFFQNKSAGGNIKLSDIDFSVGTLGNKNTIVAPGSITNQSIFVSNSRDVEQNDFANLCDILFRFSLDIAIDNQIDYDLEKYVSFAIDSKKFFQDGGTFYSLQKLVAGDATTIFDNIKFDSSIQNQYQGKDIQIVVSVEAIQSANQAYKELWQDAPKAWQDQIEQNIT